MIAYFLNGPAAGEMIELPFLGVMSYVVCPEGGRYDLIDPAYPSCALYGYTPPKNGLSKFTQVYFGVETYKADIAAKIIQRIEHTT